MKNACAAQTGQAFSSSSGSQLKPLAKTHQAFL
jgi:hypothetical protein